MILLILITKQKIILSGLHNKAWKQLDTNKTFAMRSKTYTQSINTDINLLSKIQNFYTYHNASFPYKTKILRKLTKNETRLTKIIFRFTDKKTTIKQYRIGLIMILCLFVIYLSLKAFESFPSLASQPWASLTWSTRLLMLEAHWPTYLLQPGWPGTWQRFILKMSTHVLGMFLISCGSMLVWVHRYWYYFNKN